MFFCDSCAKEQGWPTSMFKSRGRCEACGETCVCNEVKSSLLPTTGSVPKVPKGF